MQWWTQRSEILRDAVGGLPIALLVAVNQRTPEEASSAQVVVTILVIAAALAVRRRRPVVTYLVALAVVAIAQTGLEFLAIAGYTVITATRRPRPVLTVIASTLTTLAGYVRFWPELRLEAIAGDLVLIAAIALLPVVLGSAVRNARHTRAELEARNAELVELRRREAAHAVQAERLRIARELHDVVAHHVSAMTLRANAGRHVAARDPQAAADALGYVADAGRATLDEMRTFVGALRGDGSPGAGNLAPTPGFEELPELLASYRDNGLTVDAELDDVPADVPTPVGLHVYRIVEEGLTNVLRHSGARRAWVRLGVDGGVIHLTVDDNGHGPPADTSRSGHGLVGVAERVALHSGRYAFGASPHGGCRLSASLPVAPTPTAAEGSDPTVPTMSTPPVSTTPVATTPVVEA